MKMLMVLFILLLSCFGCATAMPVDLDMTLPLVYSSSCSIDLPDTCKSLALLNVYASTTAAITDSILVYSTNVAGLYGKPISVRVDRPKGTWYFFSVTRDSSNA